MVLLIQNSKIGNSIDGDGRIGVAFMGREATGRAFMGASNGAGAEPSRTYTGIYLQEVPRLHM